YLTPPGPGEAARSAAGGEVKQIVSSRQHFRGRLRARNLLLNLLLIVVLAAACRQEEEQQVRVFLDVGAEARRIVTMDRPTIVKDVLEQAEIELGPDDRVNPSENTTISEGLVITVTRV